MSSLPEAYLRNRPPWILLVPMSNPSSYVASSRAATVRQAERVANAGEMVLGERRNSQGNPPPVPPTSLPRLRRLSTQGVIVERQVVSNPALVATATAALGRGVNPPQRQPIAPIFLQQRQVQFSNPARQRPEGGLAEGEVASDEVRSRYPMLPKGEPSNEGN